MTRGEVQRHRRQVVIALACAGVIPMEQALAALRLEER